MSQTTAILGDLSTLVIRAEKTFINDDVPIVAQKAFHKVVELEPILQLSNNVKVDAIKV